MNRDFKGVWIPKEIWLTKELTLLEKVLLTEIYSLDNENHCIASNEYFAEFCNCSQSAVTKAIRHLKDLELIEELKYDGRTRKLRVVKFTIESSKIYQSDSENLLPNNIDNNTNNKTIITINSNNGESDQFFGSMQEEKSKPKKPNLYEKCIGVINDFTDDLQVRALLVDYLKFLLALNREKGNVLYVNVFKGKLNKLKDFDKNDWKEIIKQTLDNGWQGFFELKSNSTGKFNDTQNMKNYYADSEYIAEQEEWLRGLHGKTQF